jgi:hypothetical protein
MILCTLAGTDEESAFVTDPEFEEGADWPDENAKAQKIRRMSGKEYRLFILIGFIR